VTLERVSEDYRIDIDDNKRVYDMSQRIFTFFSFFSCFRFLLLFGRSHAGLKDEIEDPYIHKKVYAPSRMKFIR
jgi:hypothetical protein